MYRRFSRFLTSAFFLSSRTILIPSLEDSLEMSTISVVFLVSIRLTTSDINLPMLAPIIVYGISVITSLSFSERFLAGSNTTLPLNLILPVPVSYIAPSSLLLITIPPVGKSGPGQSCISSSVVISSLSIYAHTASTTSERLCGGILVVIPTAIPSAPFTSRLGTLTGRTSGSFSVSSKLGTKSTTFLSRSARYTSCVNFFNLASVYRMAAAPSPSIEPKFPCPSTSAIPFLKSCESTTSVSYIELSPCGWYLPIVSPTIRADFL